MRVLITGGSGFIGSNLARLSLARGHDIRIVDDLSTGYLDNIKRLDIHFIEGAIQDPHTAATAVTGMDSIVHLGALGSVPRSIQDPIATHHANATGTLTILDQARRCGGIHVVSASSSSVYGLNPVSPKSEREWVRPMSPYAVTKLATEQYTLAFQQSYEMETLAFRFFNVFGPGQRAGHPYAAVIPVFIDALRRGDPLPVNGDGTQSRDFTYVGTVCEILLDAVERKVSYPEPVNLAFGTQTTLLELIDRLAMICARVPELEFREPRPGDVQHSKANNDVLLSLFPTITPTPLDEGLRNTAAWFQSGSGVA
jgi:UDP-glucose 4-epimerase